MKLTSWNSAFAILVTLTTLSVGCSDQPAEDTDEPTGSLTSSIVDPTPPGPTELLAAVYVRTDIGGCSGTLIARDTVLTAAHCFCEQNVFASNSCALGATVTFRPDPSTPNSVPVAIKGNATVHEDYHVSILGDEGLPRLAHGGLKNDLAVVRLESPAPAHVAPIKLATTNPSSGTDVLTAGYGDTGRRVIHVGQGGWGSPGTMVQTCFSQGSTLNYDIVNLDGFDDDGKVIVFNDVVWCHGDSGGPVFDTSARTLYGVISGSWWRLRHGTIDKATTVAPYFDWIKQHTCDVDVCSDKADMCRCSAGYGNCEKDADCQQYLVCAEDVGGTFGYPSDFNVCVHPGPVEGTCACRNSGLAQLCRADALNTDAYDQCAKGFVPKCEPQFSSPTQSCGVCSCVPI